MHELSLNTGQLLMGIKIPQYLQMEYQCCKQNFTGLSRLEEVLNRFIPDFKTFKRVWVPESLTKTPPLMVSCTFMSLSSLSAATVKTTAFLLAQHPDFLSSRKNRCLSLCLLALLTLLEGDEMHLQDQL